MPEGQPSAPLDRSARLVNEVVASKRGTSPVMGKGLGDAFGTGTVFLLNLGTALRDRESSSKTSPQAK
jgi:plasmid maintenance system antidote protein VapI